MKLSWDCAILFSCFLSSALLVEHEKFKACRVYLKDCGETASSQVYFEYLQHHYRRCKYILGNLVICDLKRLENGSDPDLSFLEDIVEVSGYVYISRNEVRNIPLKSLKIIRGEPAYKTQEALGALVATKNGRNQTHALETIDLRSLVAIQHNNVIVKDNPLLCNFALTIYWEGLFVDPTQQRYIPDRSKKSLSQAGCNISKTFESCHGQCPIFNSKSYCWGPGKEMCQKMVKCENNPLKYCVDGPVTELYCDDECLGGCEVSRSNCRACKHAENDGKCVSQCPPQFIVNRADSRTIPNPEFKYNFHDTCVETCPAPFLKSNTYCVIECNLKKEIPVNGTCQVCPLSGCPEHCTEESIFGKDRNLAILDSEALRRFKSCVYYTGMLYVSEESFKGNRIVKDPIKDLSLLWNLRNLRGIVGTVYLDLRGAPLELTNLTFLENVESITMEVRGSSSGPVLQIMDGPNVELLGFRSLTLMDGSIYLRNMPKLCFVDVLKRLSQYRAENLSSEEQCIRRNAVCHSECLPGAGCWGPGANMCRHCCNLQAGDDCVAECTDRPGFYEIPDKSSAEIRFAQHTRNPGQQPYCPTFPIPATLMDNLDETTLRVSKIPPKQCGRCHPECAETCYGPDAHECIGQCKHYRDGDKCVAICPREKYEEKETKRCLPCHNACKQTHVSREIRLCSGPGDYFGKGGCTACWKVLQNTTAKLYQCLSTDCPDKHYIESHKTMEFVHKQKIDISKESEQVATGKGETGEIIQVCKPCHPYCDRCTANGTHMSICESCIFWWFKGDCVKECPTTETYVLPSGNVSIQTDHKTSEEGITSITTEAGRSRRSSIQSQSDGMLGTGMTSFARYSLSSFARNQRHCLVCHDECIQGCTGPGPEDCKSCRNYKIMRGPDKFVCNSSCPEEQPHVLHGMCLTAKEYAKVSGKSARELRDRIVIGVSISIIPLILLATIILVICLKRRAEAEKAREKLFSAYTNLLAPDKESVMKNQSGIREPNMGRLEMISVNDLEYDPTAPPLGTGAFGVVYCGVWRLSKAALLKHGCHGPQQFAVAIKVIQNDFQISPGFSAPSSPVGNGRTLDPEEEARRAAARTAIEELLQEAKVMASVEHRHCLPLIGVCLTRERHCLVSMFLELGSLDRYVKDHRAELNSLTLLSWAEQIADGMSYLEMRGIIHRDLAARNVLVQRRDLVQITDFGLAKMLEGRDEDSVVVRAGRVPIRWLAIETLQDSIYSHKTDVWSYGVTLWEIFTFGRRPYEEVETKDIKDHVMKGGRLTQPDICTLDVYMVMVRCWIEDAVSRPTFVELQRTFNNFCKTPGRYLYIQGDEYAIKYQNNSYLGSATFSAETHELKPLIHGRGVPDGSPNTKANGSAFHEGDIGILDYARLHPSCQIQGSGSEYLPQSEDNQLDAFGNVVEPNESDALLPTRSAGHSIWPLRHRTPAVGASFSPGDADRTSPLRNTKMESSNVVSRAPLASREDSWLADAPGSPAWRSSRNVEPDRATMAGHAPHPGRSVGIHSMTPQSTPSPYGPGRGFPPTPMGATANNETSFQFPATGMPSAILEGYLEPNTDRFANEPTRTPSGASNPNQSDSRLPVVVKDEYLTPKTQQTQPMPSTISDFGISNLEYFMQPYMPSDEQSQSSGNENATSETQKLPT
ncbi:hypothetical protein CRM22_002516 [Opisthorchis felineus]|uniref:receptor protein-tyrosine kinase n=1 Tax=Opisthorchis felineus TaxID=147828 RepID=A0A4S2M5N0_OPIFE|nr:hypothetical protein CRM22_002516 [Opisthorchis felineus]